jgi:hypothetical protein
MTVIWRTIAASFVLLSAGIIAATRPAHAASVLSVVPDIRMVSRSYDEALHTVIKDSKIPELTEAQSKGVDLPSTSLYDEKELNWIKSLMATRAKNLVKYHQLRSLDILIALLHQRK